jgi:hypothetical protein
VDQGRQRRIQPQLKLVETTVGRALLSEILPKGLPFATSTRR